SFSIAMICSSLNLDLFIRPSPSSGWTLPKSGREISAQGTMFRVIQSRPCQLSRGRIIAY
ncbi:MAG: hypothetical protein WBA25_16755, partial [Jannaschia sp.]